MWKIVRFFTSQRALIIGLGTLVVFDLLLVAAAFVPRINDFMTRNNTFNIIVVTCLFEIMLLLAVEVLHDMPMVVSDEDSAKEKVRELLRNDNSITTVKVLSAGLRSRADFIRSVLERNKKVDVIVVACFSSANPDELDRLEYGPSHFSVLTHRLDDEESSRLRVFQSYCTPSVRCVLLSSGTSPKYALVSWYMYLNRNQHIQGRRNPQILIDNTNSFGREMLKFVSTTFDTYANSKEADVVWPAGDQSHG